MTTGEKISRLRKENNYTQEQLADLLGVSRQSISKYESGIAYPETEKLIRLSEMFGCTVDYLLKDTVTEPSGSQSIEKDAASTDESIVGLLSKRLNAFEKKSKRVVLACRCGTWDESRIEFGERINLNETNIGKKIIKIHASD